MRAELVDFIGKLNLLEDTNPYADELAFADKVGIVPLKSSITYQRI